jgi:hypothetical protein
MPATPAVIKTQEVGATPTAPATATTDSATQNPQEDSEKLTRLHITPFTPALLKVYLAPSILPLAKNISYHAVETFPEKGFGYVELPAMEAQKLKKKLNGSTLKGSKVRIADAKPEKRKAAEDAEELEANGEPPKKRKKKSRKEQGVLEGVELPDDRKVKRGWTEPPTKSKKDRKDRDKDRDADKKSKRKESKYTKEPELLFKAKLTPVAATEEARKEKTKDKKKDKKEKNKKKREVVVHEFEKSTKTPSFLKSSKVSTEKKEAVEYVNGKGWVDEDGNVVEPEIGKVRNRRVLELVDVPAPTTTQKKSVTPSPKSSPAPKSTKNKKKAKKATPPPSSESEDDESSEVSSSSDDDSSTSEDEAEAEAEKSSPSPPPTKKADTPEISLTLPSPATKEVHPLEALFKRPKPLSLSTPGFNVTSTPPKNLAINTSFSFFEGDANAMDVDTEAPDGVPVTPHTQRDIEWRGLRSAAPTPDTAALGRRFSFPWRNGSQEADNTDVDGDADLENNTKANAAAQHLPGVVEEDEDGEEEDDDDADVGAEVVDVAAGEGDDEEKPESEFKKWFWENQGGLNRAWKKRRRDALKAKRLSDNKKAVGGRRPH